MLTTLGTSSMCSHFVWTPNSIKAESGMSNHTFFFHFSVYPFIIPSIWGTLICSRKSALVSGFFSFHIVCNRISFRWVSCISESSDSDYETDSNKFSSLTSICYMMGVNSILLSVLSIHLNGCLTSYQWVFKKLVWSLRLNLGVA